MQSWQPSLAQTLQRLRQPDRPVRVAVLGIGQELRGDDAAGVYAARALERLISACDHLLVLVAGPAPENFTGVLRRFGPDLVLLLDAAQMDAPPATVAWLAWQAADGISASTHTLPLSILATFLTTDLGCRVTLLGIQPTTISLNAPLSPAIRQTIETVVQRLAELLC
jgi:hydrogenase maturation protease HycI